MRRFVIFLYRLEVQHAVFHERVCFPVRVILKLFIPPAGQQFSGLTIGGRDVESVTGVEIPLFAIQRTAVKFISPGKFPAARCRLG